MTYLVCVYPGRLNNEYSLVSLFLLIEEHPEMTWARPTQDSKKDGMSGWVLDHLRSPSVDSTPLNHRERLTRSIIGPGVRILESIDSCDARRGVGNAFGILAGHLSSSHLLRFWCSWIQFGMHLFVSLCVVVIVIVNVWASNERQSYHSMTKVVRVMPMADWSIDRHDRHDRFDWRYTFVPLVLWRWRRARHILGCELCRPQRTSSVE